MAKAKKSTKKTKPKSRGPARSKSKVQAKKTAKAGRKAKAAAKAKPEAKARTASKANPKIKSSARASTNGRVTAGSRAPSFSLPDQGGRVVSSSSLAGKPYVLYFYPKDDTSGCTREACGFRDSLAGFGQRGVKIIGVSPDSEASHARFAGKYGLPFTLLADTERTLARAYGVWVKKQNYGREYMGILRSTFLVDGAGKVRKAWHGVKVDGHVDKVLAEARAL